MRAADVARGKSKEKCGNTADDVRYQCFRQRMTSCSVRNVLDGSTSDARGIDVCEHSGHHKGMLCSIRNVGHRCKEEMHHS